MSEKCWQVQFLSLKKSLEHSNIIFFIGVVALDGLLYVVGGDDGASNLSSVEIYNPNTNSWSILSTSMNIGRSYAGVAVIDKPPHFNT